MDNIIATASVVGQAATMFHPFFAILTIGTKTYETIRDYQKMSDKIERGTTTNLNANLNLTSNLVGLTSSIATFGAYMSVPKGNELSYVSRNIHFIYIFKQFIRFKRFIRNFENFRKLFFYKKFLKIPVANYR